MLTGQNVENKRCFIEPGPVKNARVTFSAASVIKITRRRNYDILMDLCSGWLGIAGTLIALYDVVVGTATIRPLTAGLLTTRPDNSFPITTR